MKKIFIFLIISTILSYSYSQENLKAEKEILSVLKYGTADTFENLIGYEAVGDNELIDRYPHGPFIDKNGDLLFEFNQSPFSTLKFKDNKFELLQNSVFDEKFMFPLSGQNLNGITLSSNYVYFFSYGDDKVRSVTDFINNNDISTDDLYSGATFYYPISKGIIIDYVAIDHGPYQIGIEINNVYNSKIILKDKIMEWLSNQKGNYKIGTNKILYRNDFHWTPTWQFGMGKYVARLKSGHVIFSKDDKTQNYYIRKFIIARPDGNIEFILEIPWSASQDKEEGKSFYSWAFGNWGELYALIYPPFDSKKNWDVNKKEIELVVSRNYLKYFGILNDDKIRLRKGPGTNTESLGTYPIKTGFRILENSGVKQTIGGVTDEWIKVRLLDGTEGYFFGQYVQNLYDGPGSPLPWPNVPDWD